MPVTSEEYRNSMRHFPAGVTIVTIRADGKIHGLTVSAFASVSPDPPLILIAIDHRHTAFPMMESDDASFAVNILHQDQTELSNRFAWLKDEDRFKDGDWGSAVTGAPVLLDALAWLDCTIEERYAVGAHTVYIGEVQASGLPRADEPPLVYWNRGYRRLELHESSIEVTDDS